MQTWEAHRLDETGPHGMLAFCTTRWDIKLDVGRMTFMGSRAKVIAQVPEWRGMHKAQKVTFRPREN